MQFLEIGRIVKPHGLRGRVKVLSYVVSDDLLETLDEAAIREKDDEIVRFRIRSLQVKGRCFYMEMEGIGNVEDAQALVGRDVLVPAAKLSALPAGEYYWQQLIGVDVITEEGVPVGKLNRIFPTGSNDVYVCNEGEKEILLPALEEVVRKIDLQKGMMIVRLPDGLQ